MSDTKEAPAATKEVPAPAEAPDDALVTRPDAAHDIDAIIRTIAADEQSRRRWEILLSAAPWAMSAIFGMFAVGTGIVMAKRPVPVPEMHVAIYRSDGTVEAPVERGNLSADRKAFIIRSDLQNFIVDWESYAWRANQAYYNRVSAMTAGEALQTAYQESWRKPRDPDNRETKYGEHTTRNVAAISTSFVPGSPFALTGRVLVKLTTPTGATCEWWSASLTWRHDNNTIPLDKQLTYDPSDVVVVSYFSTPADPAAKPWAC
jgi:type IV secretory pathway component VirB8